jgi:L-iditol 2-dehydrogenase
MSKRHSMRAAVLHGKEDVRIEDVALRPLARGEVRVAIKAALTCGTDLKVFKRGYHARMIVPPAVFGHELAGIISEVHPETLDWQAGERVVVANSAPCGDCFFCRHHQENLCEDLLFLNGAYAESIVVPERIAWKNMLRLGPETSFVDAALTEPLACVVQGLSDLELDGTENVLVIGSGPIGLMFAALLRHRGCAVFLAGRGEARLAIARKLGAEIIEVSREDDLTARVKSRNRRFDAVVEAVGQPATWEAAVQLVRKGGKVNLFGGCPSGTSVNLDTGLIHYSNLRLLASFHHTPATIRKALEWIELGVISSREFVDGSCSLSDLPELFRSMTSGNRAVKTLVTA